LPSAPDVVYRNRVASASRKSRMSGRPRLTVIAGDRQPREGAAGQAIQNMNVMLDCRNGGLAC